MPSMLHASRTRLRLVALALALVASPRASLASWGLDGNRVVDPSAQPTSVVLLSGASGSSLLA